VAVSEGHNPNRAGVGGANLSESMLSGPDLGQADLENADLKGAMLLGADLRGANLTMKGAYWVSSAARSTGLREDGECAKLVHLHHDRSL
jgi:uncharacterized protein YjbI with pentapeptide repeats